MSKPTKARNRNQLSRAEIKAYEARRAAARSADTSGTPGSSARPAASVTRSTTTAKRTRTFSREEEFNTIKADMKRLVLILIVLLVVLVAATIVFR